MSQEKNRGAMASKAKGWAWAAVAAMTVSCAGGVDEDRQRTPGFVPDEIPQQVAQLSFELERTTIPADGTTLVEAVAVLTDAAGFPIANELIVFDSDFGDVTWLTATATAFGSNSCSEFTNSQGRASCMMRSSFTPGSTSINANAVARSILNTEDVIFTSAGTLPGVSISFLQCEDTIGANELPTSQRILIQATQTDDPGAGDANLRPAAGIEIFLTTSAGLFDDRRSSTSVITDSLGLAELDLNFLEDERDQIVQVLAATSGALPENCAITIGEFDDAPTLSLEYVPFCIESGNPDKFQVSVLLSATPVPRFTNSEVVFGSPVGTFAPNPAGIERTSGTAETVWTIDPTESAVLPDTANIMEYNDSGETPIPGIPIIAQVNVGGTVPLQINAVLPVVGHVPGFVCVGVEPPQGGGADPVVEPPADGEEVPEEPAPEEEPTETEPPELVEE